MDRERLEYNLIHRFNVGDALRRSAARHPGRIALRYLGRSLSYRELDGLANRIARLLEARGIGRGDVVTFLGLNSPEFLATFFATARIGAAFCPINAMLRGGEIRYVLEKTRARALIVDRFLVGNLEGADADVPHRLFLGEGDVPAGYGSLPAELAACSDEPVERYVENEDAATILFTSGTTARPKGVVNTHLNWYAALISAVADLGIHREHRPLLCLPLFHSAGLYMAFASIATGAESVLLPRVDGQAILEAVERDRCTVLALPATGWLGLLRLPAFATADLSSLRKALVFQYLPVDAFRRLRERLPQAEWINYWGQTEMIPLGASTPPADLERKLVAPDPVGLPHLPLEVRVVDEDMNELPPGRVGELVARGPSVTPGYLDEPEANRELFRGGWHHTGDMGYRDEEGFLYFVDRKKDMIKTGGENVSSQEVEEVLARHPRVAEVAVIGLPDPYWVEAVTAVVVPTPGEPPTPEELIAFARQHLAPFKVPKRVVLVEELPKNPTGKVLKRVLRDRLSQELGLEAHAPRAGGGA